MIKTYRYSDININEIFNRSVDKRDVSEAVAKIIADVRADGDEAVKRYAAEFDGFAPETLEMTDEEREEAVAKVDPKFMSILEEAADHIRLYHENQKRTNFVVTERPGVVLGQRIMPLKRVGVYVPGGTASYPSTVLMDCIPAKIAGVEELIMVTPVKEGGINPDIAAAAKIAGVDRIFKTGGAQAIAALAYGTESVPRVDKIVGPGNTFVAEAKRQVFGAVSIDMIAGPSEILVIADASSDPAIVAADMLSQAEHDRMASAVLVTDSEELAAGVAEEIERQLGTLPREEIARASIENNGKIIIAASIAEAVDIANGIAPEHLELFVDDAFGILSSVRNAGSVFVGKNAPEALGDYFAGPNHTLPTGGTARFSSPLSVDDFIKKSSFTYYTKEALEKEAGDIAVFARREGLEAHARSVLRRPEEQI